MATALLFAVEAKSTPLAAMAGISYLITPAVIHGVHHRGGLSALSIVLRIALPIVGAVIGNSMSSCHASTDYEDSDPFCGLGEVLIGGTLGVIAAVAIDASLARQETPAAPSDAQPRLRSPQPAHISLTAPIVVPTANGGASLLLGGRF